jgi:uncharacterized protein (DUF58 family)
MTPALAELVRRVRRLRLAARKAVAGPLGGAYRSAFHGSGLDFAEVRAYQPGDDVRHLHPQVTARAGVPFVKRYAEERERTVLLAADLSASLDFGSRGTTKREVAAELAALVAFAAVANRDRVGLVLFSDRVERYVPPGGGPRHAQRVVRDVLAHAPAGRGTDLAGALAFLLRVARRRATAFVLSDFRAAGAGPALRLAGRRHDLVAVRVSDPLEEALPDAGLVQFADAETGRPLLVDTSHPGVRAGHARAAALRRERVRAQTRAAGVDLVEATTEGGHLDALVDYFRRRGRGVRA